MSDLDELGRAAQSSRAYSSSAASAGWRRGASEPMSAGRAFKFGFFAGLGLWVSAVIFLLFLLVASRVFYEFNHPVPSDSIFRIR